METKKANLFIVGAMRAGTTSFVELLSKHPQIYVSPIKEPNYFVDRLPLTLYEPSRFFNLNRYLNSKFPDPLHIAKIETLAQYEQLFSLATHEVYRVDASTAYLHAPEAAANIATYNSEAKVIVILRDPLQRAYSHYRMDLALGRIHRSFDAIMRSEIAQYRSNELRFGSYLGMSCYAAHLKRFESLFGEQLLVLELRNLVNTTDIEMTRISNFLGISAFVNPILQKMNKTKTIRFQKLLYLLKQLGFKDYFSKYFRKNFRQQTFKKISKDRVSDMKLSEGTLLDLKGIFEKESPVNYR